MLCVRRIRIVLISAQVEREATQLTAARMVRSCPRNGERSAADGCESGRIYLSWHYAGDERGKRAIRTEAVHISRFHLKSIREACDELRSKIPKGQRVVAAVKDRPELIVIS